MADILGGFGSAFQFGQGIANQGADAKRRSQLSQLASQAYTAPQSAQTGILSQMAAIDPASAQAQQGAFQSDEDRRNKTMANMARMLTNAPEQFREGLYQQIRPGLAQFGIDAPPNYTPEVGQFAEQIAAAWGGGSGSNVQSTYVNAQGQRVAIMRDGSQQVLGDANQSIRVLEQPGALPYGVVTSGGVAGQVVPLGGGRPQGQQRAPGEVPFTIDPSLPPQVQASIRANESQWAQAPDMGQVQIGQPQAPAGPVRTPTAGEIEAQKQAAQLAYLPAQQAIETQGALARARGEAGIQTEALGERATQAAQIERRADLPKLRQQITDLRQLRNDLGTKYSTGPLNAVIPDMLQSADNQVFLTRVNEAVLDAASMLTGVISDKDMEFLRKATISMTNKEDANRDILDRKIRILESAEKQAQGGQSQGAGRRLKFNPATGRIE